MAGPGQQGIALRDDPVGGAVEVEGKERRGRGLCANQERQGCSRGDALVQERNAQQSTADRCEDREGGRGVVDLAGDRDKGAAAGVQVLRGRKGDGKQRVGRAQDLEAGV